MIRALAFALVGALVGSLSLVAGCTPAPRQGTAITPLPEVLTGAFEPGFVGEGEDEGARYPVRVVRLGAVRLSSGRVILSDPFLMSSHDVPLTVRFSPGDYPVDLAVADTGAGGHRIALARLVISSRPPVRWEMAVTEGQDPAALKEDEQFGYGVDAGTGAFVDAAVPAWLARTYPPSDPASYMAVVEDWQTRGEDQGPRLGIPYGFALIEPLGPGGAAMFSSGWGDGFYASWIGYDAQDEVAVIVTDFQVLKAVSDSR